MICTTSRRIQASASTNQGGKKGDLTWLRMVPPKICEMRVVASIARFFLSHSFDRLWMLLRDDRLLGPVDPSFRAL
jgi:hypothetical protein